MRVKNKPASFFDGGSGSGPVKRSCINAAVLLALGVSGQAFAQAAPEPAASQPSPPSAPAQSPASAPAQKPAASSTAADSDGPTKLESVVVTARKRAESVQDIPASVK